MSLENFEFHVEADGAARILANIPYKTATSRDAEIQIQTLNRMLNKYDHDFPPQLRNTPSNEARGDPGPRHADHISGAVDPEDRPAFSNARYTILDVEGRVGVLDLRIA